MSVLADRGGATAVEGPREAETGPQQAGAPPGGLAVEGGVRSPTDTSTVALRCSQFP